MKRKLGGGERTYWIANQWSPNNVVAVAELDGLLEHSRLQAAIAALQQAHPLLRMCVLPDADGCDPRFVPRARAALPLETLDAREAGFDALIAAELNHWIDPRACLVRFVYANDGERSLLIVSLLHIIADASAAMIALRDVLQAYERGAAAIERRPDRQRYEALLPAEHAGWRSVPSVLRTQKAALAEALQRKPQRLPKQAEVPMQLRRNGYSKRALSPAQLEALRRACSAHSVTVHGLLLAALGIAIADELGLRAQPGVALNIGSPLSVRSALQPPIADELGSYVCTLNVYLGVGDDRPLWTIAREANEELQRRRERDEPFAVLNLAGWIAPRSARNSPWVVKLAESQGPGNVCLSNIGAFDMPTETAGIAVRNSHWCASLSITGYFLCAVCTTARGLQLDFAYIEDVVTAARAQRIIDRTLRELEAVAGPSRELRQPSQRFAERPESLG
ncbi:MAG TPA: condensation domain-containing protein [Polyangiales bacterium]|nr:condensation domain-containing protein [Polyangiales bacterium]